MLRAYKRSEHSKFWIFLEVFFSWATFLEGVFLGENVISLHDCIRNFVLFGYEIFFMVPPFRIWLPLLISRKEQQAPTCH